MRVNWGKSELANKQKTPKFKPKWTKIGRFWALAGETRFEHATYGFGDRYSTVEPLP